MWMEIGWFKPCVEYVHEAFVHDRQDLEQKWMLMLLDTCCPFGRPSPFPIPNAHFSSLNLNCKENKWMQRAIKAHRGRTGNMLKPFISLSYAFLSHGLFGLGDKPNTSTRAFYFCSCVLLFCKGLKSKYLWEPLLFCLVFGKKWKKKDDDDSSALFQIMHFLSPGTVRKQQTIK